MICQGQICMLKVKGQLYLDSMSIMLTILKTNYLLIMLFKCFTVQIISNYKEISSGILYIKEVSNSNTNSKK